MSWQDILKAPITDSFREYGTITVQIENHYELGLAGGDMPIWLNTLKTLLIKQKETIDEILNSM